MHRNPRFGIRFAPPTLPAILICLAVFGVTLSAQEPTTVIRGARVFTGDEVLDVATVTLRGREIAAVTAGDSVPGAAGRDAIVIDGRGMTLLPGLIDAHAHSFGSVLEQALNFGVTTVLDMFTEPTSAAEWRRQQDAGRASGRADLFSAGVLVTVDGGHGTQFGVPIPTLDDPDRTEAFVAARVDEGADYIKVIYEHGETSGRPVPTHAAPTLPRIVRAAHTHGKLAVFHVSTVEEAMQAIAAGADGLVHIYHDRADTGAVADAAARAGMFVVPTLAITETFFGTGGGAAAAVDPRITPFLTPAQRGSLIRDFGSPANPDGFQAVLTSVAALHAAGVPILAGTDAPNPGTAHGPSLHRELSLLVAAGLSPVEALRAATAAPADAFGLADRGRIAPGRKADVILVRGDATEDVLATRNLAGIWKDGVRFERVRYEAVPSGRSRITAGVLSDFEDLNGDALAAAGWILSTDSLAGGSSTVSLSLAGDGAGRSGGALRISGEIASGFPFPWAGVMFNLGPGMMQPVDASAIRMLVFDARGEGQTYRVMAFAESLGQVPSTVEFEAANEWTRVEIPLDAFTGLEPAGAMAFLIGGPGSLGEFRLDIDNVELRE